MGLARQIMRSRRSPVPRLFLADGGGIPTTYQPDSDPPPTGPQPHQGFWGTGYGMTAPQNSGFQPTGYGTGTNPNYSGGIQEAAKAGAVDVPQVYAPDIGFSGAYSPYQAQTNALLNSSGSWNVPQQATGAQQGTLASQLMALSQGRGPNLGQTQFRSATQQNDLAAASALGSARGLNSALAARLVGYQQAGNNQQAASQSAALAQQLQLAALQQEGGVLGQERQGDIYGQMANTQQLSATGGLQEQQNQLAYQNAAAQAGLNFAAQQANASMINGDQQSQEQLAESLVGGALGAAGGLGAAAIKAAHGGVLYARGGKVPVMLSPGEKPIPAAIARSGPQAVKRYVAAKGGKVPGRAKVKGDSYANDTFATSMPPGTIIIPRSIINSKDAADHAARFVAMELAKHGKRMAGGGRVEMESEATQRREDATMGKLGAQIQKMSKRLAMLEKHMKRAA